MSAACHRCLTPLEPGIAIKPAVECSSEGTCSYAAWTQGLCPLIPVLKCPRCGYSIAAGKLNTPPTTSMSLRVFTFPLQPHQERERTERNELSERFTKLQAFLETGTFAGLPIEEQQLMREQVTAMSTLLQVLDKRLDQWKPKDAVPEHILNTLPRWQCHKIVRAVKIHEITLHDPTGGQSQDWDTITSHPEFNGGFIFPASRGFTRAQGGYQQPIPFSADYYRKHKPQVGGYFVVYPDGYLSYSPSEPFTSGYSLITD